MTEAAQTAVDAAIAAAVAVADAADAGDYATRQDAEAAIAAARTLLQAAVDQVRADYPTSGAPLVGRLKALGAGLLGLGRDLAEALATERITLQSERSLLDIARERYATDPDEDLVVWASRLRTLNPELPHPGRIPAGTELEVYLAR